MIAIDDRRRGAAVEGPPDEVVTVETLALEGHEEFALPKPARISRHSAETHICAGEPGANGARCSRGVHHGALHATSTRVACSASRNGVRTPARS